MANVTYLLGAGASFDALPIVEQFEGEIQRVIDKLIEDSGMSAEQPSQSHSAYQKAIEDLKWLLDGCKAHASVDTFARVFYLLDENNGNYARAKASVILFFELYHYFFRKIDKRYDAFLASIMERARPRLPKHVNIISWNYDYEIERALVKYFGVITPSGVYHECEHEIQIHLKGCNPRDSEDKCRLIKLNGTSGYFKERNIQYGLGVDGFLSRNSSPVKENGFSVLEELVKAHRQYNYGIGPEGYRPSISFAWEEKSRNDILNKAQQVMMNTQSLVIIGYSFPYFNREVDRRLFDLESSFSALTHIYVQDRYPDDIIESLKGIIPSKNLPDITIKPIVNLRQFYIPHEMGPKTGFE